MPRHSKGTRLYLRPSRREGDSSKWVIKDGTREIGTGCSAGDRAGAEKRLAEYLQTKYKPVRRHRDISQINIADVLAVYLSDVVPRQANIKGAAGRAERLAEFFGDKTLSDISGALCMEYAEHRGHEGGARRDLQDLAAAINYHRKQGFHREMVCVSLPSKGKSRMRWLTRSEVARLLWVCLTTREIQNGKQTDKRPLKHLARFILIGVYTGSRPGAILGLSWNRQIGRGWVDLDRGLIYRHASGSKETAKRQPPVPMAPQLARMMRLWAKSDDNFGPVIHFYGQSILSVKTALGRAVKLAGLEKGISAYTIRHTTGSWLVQKGVSTRKVAEILGTGEAMVERHYGHLAPDHLIAEVGLIGRK